MEINDTPQTSIDSAAAAAVSAERQRQQSDDPQSAVASSGEDTVTISFGGEQLAASAIAAGADNAIPSREQAQQAVETILQTGATDPSGLFRAQSNLPANLAERLIA